MPKQEPREQVQQIPLSEIHPFRNHPFKVLDDELMQQTIDSIMQVGILNPAIIRPDPEGGYEMVAGHRRLHAADLAGLKTIPAIVSNLTDDEAVILKLNGLYQTFNTDHPEDFRGHSLSVSDIVALRQDGVVSCHYVDPRGFKELPGFLQPENYLKNAEMAVEDDYGMIDGIVNNGPKQTSAEIEADAMSGKPVSLLSYVEAVRREQQEQKEAPKPEKKPSVLAKLQAPLSEPKKTARSKSAEREM